LDTVTIFHRGLSAHFGIRAGAKTLRDIAADLQTSLHLSAFEGLRIRVRADEVHAFEPRAHHVRHSVATAATDTEHLDHSVLAVSVH
jgi:hypothetical protein